MSSNIGFRRIARAFLDGKSASLKNDTSTGATLLYHGNLIAERRADGSVWATLAGWNTVSTRARFNALAGLLDVGWRVYTRDWDCYLWDYRKPDVKGVELGSREWTRLYPM